MAFLRVFVIVAALACLVFAGAYVATRDRKYLHAAVRVLQFSAVAALIFFGVLFVEELWFSKRP